MVDIASALVARDQPAEAVDSGEGALDDPSVSTWLLAYPDAAPKNAGSSLTVAAGLSTATMIIGLVARGLFGGRRGRLGLPPIDGTLSSSSSN